MKKLFISIFMIAFLVACSATSEDELAFGNESLVGKTFGGAMREIPNQGAGLNIGDENAPGTLVANQIAIPAGVTYTFTAPDKISIKQGDDEIITGVLIDVRKTKLVRLLNKDGQIIRTVDVIYASVTDQRNPKQFDGPLEGQNIMGFFTYGDSLYASSTFPRGDRGEEAIEFVDEKGAFSVGREQ